MFQKLQFRILVILAAVLIVNGFLNIFLSTDFFKTDYSEVVQDEMREVGRDIKEKIKDQLEAGLDINHIGDFNRLCREAKEKNHNVYFVAVVDLDGKILYHCNPSLVGNYEKREKLAAAFKVPDDDMVHFIENGRMEYHFVIPYYTPAGKQIGAVWLQIAEKAFAEKQGEVIRDILVGLASSFFIALLLFTIALVFWITRPLKKLTRTAEEISENGADKVELISSDSQDEIGRLSGSFNRMILHLRNSTVSKDYVNSILECMTDSLVIFDAEFIFVSCNKSFELLVENREADFAGKHASELFFLDNEKSLLEKIISEGKVVNFESYINERNGKSVSLLLGFSVINNSSGRAEHIVCNIKDITEIKRKTLELEEARRAAEQANDAKSAFLANMSHEIRTPINGIVGMTDLVLMEDIPDDQRSRMHLIKTSTNSLLRIIDDILDYSRIESGKLLIDLKPFDVRGMICELKELHQAAAEKKKLEMDISVDSRIPRMLCGDAVRIKQILSNFTGNAVKFTEKGSVRISAEYKGGSGSEVIAEFSVSDTGIGIRDENKSLLFKKFSQLDSSFSKKYQGTGLGLAISSGLAELMGGKVSVESIYGKGSVFLLRLRFAAADSSDCEDPAQINIPSDTASENKINILVAEDDVISRMFMEQLLEMNHFFVFSAGNGKEAYDICGKEKINLVIMDVQMPVVDGISAMKMIRENEKPGEKRIPIIAMTGYALKGDDRKFTDAGFDDYLPKPLAAFQVIEMITKWIQCSERISAYESDEK